MSSRSRDITVLSAVTSCYENEVKLSTEYEIAGTYGGGSLDWAMLMKSVIGGITEVKKQDVNYDVAQNSVQLQSVMQ
ncbi:12988_t:CDS:2 [Entrophospora sp. SA101]|nr:12988_t:CDS:2 [Entrophospora sp. SA101]